MRADRAGPEDVQTLLRDLIIVCFLKFVIINLVHLTI